MKVVITYSKSMIKIYSQPSPRVRTPGVGPSLFFSPFTVTILFVRRTPL